MKEILDLEEKWKKENSELRSSLSDQLIELNLARMELKRLEAELARKDEGLGSASTSLDRLKEDLATVRRDSASTKRAKEQSVQENHKLLVCVDNARVGCVV